MTQLIFILSSMAMAASPAPSETTLWDSWYVVTVKDEIKLASYNEKFQRIVSDKGDRKGQKMVRYQSDLKKLEEGYLLEEHLGAFSFDDADLTPAFYNFHSTYRTTETFIDGNITNGKKMIVKVRKGNTDLPLVEKTFPGKTILSVFFPIWISQRLKGLKVGTKLKFAIIFEDNLEVNFDTIPGEVTLKEPDEIAKTTKTKKLFLNYKGLQSYWWVEDNGQPVRVEIPLQETVIKRVTKSEAQKFLES